MAAASQAFFDSPHRAGLVIGIVPGAVAGLERIERREEPAAATVRYTVGEAYPNPWVEIAIFTHLPDRGADGTSRSSRNHLNVLSANVTYEHVFDRTPVP